MNQIGGENCNIFYEREKRVKRGGRFFLIVSSGVDLTFATAGKVKRRRIEPYLHLLHFPVILCMESPTLNTFKFRRNLNQK